MLMHVSECARCGVEFEQRKSNHRFCSTECRHAGERKDWEPPPASPEQIARLFGEGRHAFDRVREDDWHPRPVEFRNLDTQDTVERRRRWYLELRERGMV
jgi:hypothetical protein